MFARDPRPESRDERRDKIFAEKTENAKNLDQKQRSFQYIYSAWGIFIFWPRKNQLLGGG